MNQKERYQKAKQVFYQALELTGDTREQYLKQTCGKDPALLNEVRALLNEGGTERFSQAIADEMKQQAAKLLAIPAEPIAIPKKPIAVPDQPATVSHQPVTTASDLNTQLRSANSRSNKTLLNKILFYKTPREMVVRFCLLLVGLFLAQLLAQLSWHYLAAKFFSPTQSPIQSAPISSTNPASVKFPLELNYSIVLREMSRNNRGNHPVTLVGQEVIFHDGDRIKFNLSNEHKLYLYLINESPLLVNNQPKYRLLFPLPSEDNLLLDKQSIEIPTGSDPGFEFSAAKGTEKIWLVGTREPVELLETMRSALNEKDLGELTDPWKIQQLQQLLTQQPPAHPERNDEQNLMYVHADGDMLVALLKLVHG